MQKVIGVNLNGVAYQVEEGGYQALVAYLDRAQAQLADNPDRAEILADLEQAIGEKCHARLGPHKTVVTAAEIDRILTEMGPVDGSAGTEETSGGGPGGVGGAGGAAGPGSAPRRLYQIREGAMLSGVCNGLGAYFNLDPTIVRIIFVLLALVTQGLWILVYLVLMIVMPYATTSEERAAAHGERFTAQDLIDRAKRQYAEIKERKAWKHEWRRTRLEWRRQWRRLRWHPPSWGGPSFWRPWPAWMMATAPLFAIVNVALLVLLAFVLISLATTHAIFGLAMPAGLPLWAAILIAIAIYTAVASPFHHVHRAAWYGDPSAVDWWGPWIGLLWLTAIAVSIWWGYRHVPEVHEFIERLPAVWQKLVAR
jgi:phage shock protein PspC (stress-responsive transcriptional regulator)